MKFWIGVTDDGWFEYLRDIKPDEVNFWQPSGVGFRAIEQGAPFLFKLHSPQNFIVGGGFFVRFSRLPLSMAWNVFEEKNGAHSFSVFREAVTQYQSQYTATKTDPMIGCTVLTSPFFFDETDWIPQPEDWSPNIVRGKTYDTDESVGYHVWEEVRARIYHYQLVSLESHKDQAWNIVQQERYGPAYPFRPRLGQGAFRVAVTEAYKRRCAVTGERTLPVLEASHIKPYAESGPHDVSNDLLLRSDMHILFDRGYVTVSRDMQVEVSSRIREEFENGRDYYAFHGKELAVLPSRELERPSAEYLDWHNQNVFLP